jgi:hypothetical protein
LSLWLALTSLGCSADAVPVPEPSVETPGAFVAVETSANGMLLFRTLGRSSLENGDYLMLLILYAERPRSFEHARELARQPALREENHSYFYEESRLVARPHEVVWFRTLTAEETAPRAQ